jgi:hypothetical protein
LKLFILLGVLFVNDLEDTTMKAFASLIVFILLLLASFKARALNSYSQCSLDERPLLLEHEIVDEHSKNTFEIKVDERIIKQDMQTFLNLKNTLDFGLVSDKGAKYEEFYIEDKKYHLKHLKKFKDQEFCWPKYAEEKDLNLREKKSLKDLSLSCSIYQAVNPHIVTLSDDLFYKKPDVEKIKKRIEESKTKSVALEKSHKFFYYSNQNVYEAEIKAVAKINPAFMKSYRCQEDSEIVVCGENCLKYTRHKIYPGYSVSDTYRLDVRGEKNQYLLEFELSSYQPILKEDLNEEDLEKRLLKKLDAKKEEKALSLKELYNISNELTQGKPFEIYSIRAVKYN